MPTSPLADKGLQPMTSGHVSLILLRHTAWDADPAAEVRAGLLTALETGAVACFAQLSFSVSNTEAGLFSASIAASMKNVSYDASNAQLGGTAAQRSERRTLSEMLARFSDQTSALIDRLLPAYRGRVTRGRTSFRPVEVAGRQTSWRKDDTRLHVDAFPATPVHGRRILRVFSNVNPGGRPRVWRVGESFDAIANRFGPGLGLPR